MKRILHLLAVLSIFGVNFTTDEAYAQTKPLRLNGVLFGVNDMSQFVPVYGSNVGGGTLDDSTAINNALAGASPGATVYLPATTGGYNIGTTTIVIPTGVSLVGAGRNASKLKYAGTGCAVQMASTGHSSISHLAVFPSNAAAGMRGICLNNIAADSKFNTIEDVQIVSTAGSPPTAGSVGIFFDGSGGAAHALYWNKLDHVEIGGFDKGIRMLGSVGSANGPNANSFYDVMVFASNIGASLEAYAGENTFFSFFCSASGYAGTDCVVLGDATNPTSYNAFYGLTSDQGVGPRTYTVSANAVGNFLQSNSQSSGTNVDSGTNTVIEELLTSKSSQGLFNPKTMTITPIASTSGSPSGFSYTAPANTTLANAEDIDINWNLSAISQITGGGTLAAMRSFVIQPRHYTATSATTTTNAATLDIVNAPTCDTNMTCTNAYALRVETGPSIMRALTVDSLSATNGSVLIATGQSFDSFNASSTVNFATTNATTVNQGKAGAAWTENGIMQTPLPGKPATLASASTIAPTTPITHITGSSNISTITAPTNFAQTGGGGCLVLVFDAIGGTWDALGNIMTAGAPAYIGQAVEFCYDASATKFYPTSTNAATAGAGTQTGSSPITLFKSASAVTSVTSGEIDGQTYTIPANTLNTDGQMITFESSFVHAANVNSTTYKTYFAGTNINANISNVSGQLSEAWFRVVRTSSTTARVYSLVNTGTASTVGNVQIALTGLNFATTNVIKNSVTGATTNGDLTAVSARVEWWP